MAKHGTRFYLKQAMLVVVAYALTACSAAWQNSQSQGASRKVRSGVHPSSPVDQVIGVPEKPADGQTAGGETALVGSGDANSDPTVEDPADSKAYDPHVSSSNALASEGRQIKDPQQILDEALEFCRASQDFWGQGDFDNAIASLDEAYSLILQVDTNEHPKSVQQKEDIRFMISKRMLEIYASQHTVVNGNHDAIPMVMNGHIQKEIKLFQGAERKFFLRAFKRSGRYRPAILKALAEAGVPKELSWLPLIESGFKVKALSRARALGLWQFIPSTGYKFGLKRDQWIDERMDERKSTLAAIAYLQELHKIFGDWCTVLAAYNCGEARVLRVIRTQNIQYLDNFWDLYEKLPWETARYVPRFLAALHIINDPDRFGFDLTDLDPPLTYEWVTVSKQVRLKDISKALQVPGDQLEMLNPELRYKVTPATSYQLKVPEGQGPTLMAKLDGIPVYKPPRRHYAYHRVRPGQTLSQLARRYHTSIRAIMVANNIRSRNFIRAGQKLKIPLRGSGRIQARASETQGYGSSQPLRYRVKRGDSLWLLARRHDTNIQEIMSLNRLKSSRLHIGQELLIRKGTHSVEPEVGTKTYKVKRGDSPYHIAVKHNMKLKRFLSLNDLTPRSKIYPGQVLQVDAN
ncbi:MAG: LysM peptidoglycan-binding domain-containing protein [Deltaproteobacteria bacterium]|jgi:membrane-bound lytic murein transglycosylase D